MVFQFLHVRALVAAAGCLNVYWNRASRWWSWPTVVLDAPATSCYATCKRLAHLVASKPASWHSQVRTLRWDFSTDGCEMTQIVSSMKRLTHLTLASDRLHYLQTLLQQQAAWTGSLTSLRFERGWEHSAPLNLGPLRSLPSLRRLSLVRVGTGPDLDAQDAPCSSVLALDRLALLNCDSLQFHHGLPRHVTAGTRELLVYRSWPGLMQDAAHAWARLAVLDVRAPKLAGIGLQPFLETVGQLPALTDLSLRDYSSQCAKWPVFKLLPLAQRLTRLQLGKTDIDDWAVGWIFRHLSRLQFLGLSWCPRLTRVPLETPALLPALQTLHTKRTREQKRVDLRNWPVERPLVSYSWPGIDVQIERYPADSFEEVRWAHWIEVTHGASELALSINPD